MTEHEPPNTTVFHVDAQRKPGRNAPCWCGSGKRYKSCHEQLDRFLRSLPKISALLIEIARPWLSPNLTRDQTHAAMTLAAFAWNITRFEGDERQKILEETRAGLTEEGRALLPALMERAERWPEDKRTVHTVDVTKKPDGTFDVDASAISPPEWEERFSVQRHSRPTAPKTTEGEP